MKLYVTRHGETTWNALNKVCGLTDAMLTENGIEQAKILAERLNISQEQLKYVTNSAPGEGLLFFENIILPFVDHFPKDTQLYRLMTTKLEETKHKEEAA